MNLTTIDEITRRGLLDNNLPIHWYFEYMNHAANCLRELTFDTLQIINTVNLPVSTYGSADLPSDFVDDLAVCVPIGSMLVPLSKQDWLTPLRIHDTTSGAFVPYETQSTDEEENTVWGLPFGYSYYWNLDSYGSSTGGQYGSRGGTYSGYKIVKNRRQIQMTDDFVDSAGDTSIILQYISNGQSIDNATQIDYLAFSCIRAWQEWKANPNRNNDRSPEGRHFYNQKRRLRSLLNPTTVQDIRNVLHSAYTASVKT